jgi:hypothetical protein
MGDANAVHQLAEFGGTQSKKGSAIFAAQNSPPAFRTPPIHDPSAPPHPHPHHNSFSSAFPIPSSSPSIPALKYVLIGRGSAFATRCCRSDDRGVCAGVDAGRVVETQAQSPRPRLSQNRRNGRRTRATTPKTHEQARPPKAGAQKGRGSAAAQGKSRRRSRDGRHRPRIHNTPKRYYHTPK